MYSDHPEKFREASKKAYADHPEKSISSTWSFLVTVFISSVSLEWIFIKVSIYSLTFYVKLNKAILYVSFYKQVRDQKSMETS